MKKEKNRVNLAVLISGRGSNLKAIIDAIKRGYLDRVDLKAVVANNDAPGLKYARDVGVDAYVVDRIVKGVKLPKEEHDKKVMNVLEKHDIDLIVLAGYDQVLQKEFVERYRWRIMNIHPSLLPSFGGNMHAQKDAFDYGVKITGCTVHYVDTGIDTGPIIIQAAVPVKDSDTDQTLTDRILEHEHIIYPKAIKMFSENHLKVSGRKVIVTEPLRVSVVENPRDLMRKIGVEENAVEPLLEKFRVCSLLIEGITPREAMIIKQEMLSLGADCAVPKECVLNNLIPTSVILMGNRNQLGALAKKLTQQAFNLPKVGEKIEMKFREVKSNEP